MSAQLGHKKLALIKPPDKGSFPLDHDGECKHIIENYLKCLKVNDLKSVDCRDLTQEYLRCRMDHNLMAKTEWKNLGFKEKNGSS